MKAKNPSVNQRQCLKNCQNDTMVRFGPRISGQRFRSHFFPTAFSSVFHLAVRRFQRTAEKDFIIDIQSIKNKPVLQMALEILPEVPAGGIGTGLVKAISGIKTRTQ